MSGYSEQAYTFKEACTGICIALNSFGYLNEQQIKQAILMAQQIGSFQAIDAVGDYNEVLQMVKHLPLDFTSMYCILNNVRHEEELDILFMCLRSSDIAICYCSDKTIHDSATRKRMGVETHTYWTKCKCYCCMNRINEMIALHQFYEDTDTKYDTIIPIGFKQVLGDIVTPYHDDGLDVYSDGIDHDDDLPRFSSIVTPYDRALREEDERQRDEECKRIAVEEPRAGYFWDDDGEINEFYGGIQMN